MSSQLPNPMRADEDPMVIACFQEHRSADDIYVVDCPRCGWFSYYNEGSHATCRNCGKDLMPEVEAGNAITMADYWSDAVYPCDEPETV